MTTDASTDDNRWKTQRVRGRDRKFTKSRPRGRSDPAGQDGLDPFCANAGTSTLANGRAPLFVLVSLFAPGPWWPAFLPSPPNPPQPTPTPPTLLHALLHALLVAELNSKAQAGAMSMAQPSEGPWAWALRWPSTPSSQGRVIPAGARDAPDEAAQEGRRWSTFEPLFSSLGMGPAHFPKQMSGEGGSGKSSSPLHRPGRPPNASRARSPGPIFCGCSFFGVCWRGGGPWS